MIVNTPITLIPPCPPHEWAHAPTVGYFRCSKCGQRVDHSEPEYTDLIKQRAAFASPNPSQDHSA